MPSNKLANPEGKPLTNDAKRVKWTRERLTVLKKMVEGAYLEFTELLYEAAQGQYFKEWGFDTFDEYIKQELDWQERKGWYFVAIQKKLVVEGKVSKDKLQKIGWSKASRLTSLPASELTEGKAEKWVEKAEGKTFTELEAEVRRVNARQADKNTKEIEAEADNDFTPIRFLLRPGQVKNVEGALKLAERITGSDKRNNLLDMICLDFNGSRAEEGKVKMENLIKGIERVYGVEIIACRVSGNDYEIEHGAKLATKLVQSLQKD